MKSNEGSVRIAWFSPFPPSRSGIAAYTAELLPLMWAKGYEIDPFVESNAHEFVWKHRRQPYDLAVYQLGNAACHDYMWAYLFRYRGLVVLHDAQLHQARALALTKRWQPRRDDYLAEFCANHPDAPPHIGEVVAAGFGSSVFAHWPHIRLVVESARLTVVHNRRLCADLRVAYPRANLDAIEMGVSDPLRGPQCEVQSPECGVRIPGAECPGGVHSTRTVRAGVPVRGRHGIPADAVVLAAFGGMTPEKRIGSLVRALSTTASRVPQVHLMLVGSAADYYDVLADARRWAVAHRVHVTGYVPDAELPDYLRAADLCACLRWPTNRETSASWLRCLAAGRATFISDLADLGDVPTLDPRGWRVLDTSHPARDPVAVSIDVVDEDHSLQLALDRLATDVALRERLGHSARMWWRAHHQLDAMAVAYERVLAAAIAFPPPAIELPPHLTDDASQHGRALARKLGVADRLATLFRN